MSANLVGASPPPAPQQQTLRITPQQYAGLGMLDMVIAQLQATANVVGGLMKLEKEADIILEGLKSIHANTGRLKDSYSSPIQIAKVIP